MDIINELINWKNWDELNAAAIALRRHLHMHPELGYEEFETAKLIRTTLDKAGISWRSCTETGTIATLCADKQNAPHIAFRGDMDALPMAEKTDVAWRSNNAGKMHACGHDGHSATLLASLLWMHRHQDQLSQPVSFIFQPAEEGLHGADKMVKAGALENIDAIYGWHNWPAIPFGKAVCPDGPVMSANGTFEITVQGYGGHSSQPELCRDPVLAAAAITMNLQQIVSRRLAPQTPAVLSLTSIDAKSGPTIIPQNAKLSGSIRVANTTDRDFVFEEIIKIAAATAQSYGVEVTTEVLPRLNATINNDENAAIYRTVLHKELGEEWQDKNLAVPIMASEDFSYFLQHCAGAFALIGADDGTGEHQKPCHHQEYDFNDALIAVVVRIFCHISGAIPPK